MKKTLTTLFLFLVAFSYSQDFTQSKDETKVIFKIKNFGINVDGDFGEVSIQTNFDSKQLDKSYINATIAVKSIDTGIKGRDKHILKEDYFDENNYKNITLQSTKIEKGDQDNYTLFADLTIKSTTKKLAIPLTITESNNRLSITSQFQINRRDFKIGGGSLVMGKKVKIQVNYSGTK